MRPAAPLPALGGEWLPFLVHEPQGSLCPRVTTLEPARKAAAFFLNVSDVARQGRMTSKKGHNLHNNGDRQILEISRKQLAPDAADAIFQEVVRLAHYGRTDQSMGAFLLEFHAHWRKSEAGMVMGGGFPEEYFPIL